MTLTVHPSAYVGRRADRRGRHRLARPSLIIARAVAAVSSSAVLTVTGILWGAL